MMEVEPKGWQKELSLPARKKSKSQSPKFEKVNTVIQEYKAKKEHVGEKRRRDWPSIEHIPRTPSERISRRLSRSKNARASVSKAARVSARPAVSSKSKGHTKRMVTLDVVKEKLQHHVSAKQIDSLFHMAKRNNRGMQKLHERYKRVFTSAQARGAMNEALPSKILEFSLSLEQFQASKTSFEECMHAFIGMDVSDDDLLFFVTQFQEGTTLSPEAKDALDHFLTLVESRKNWDPKMVPDVKNLLDFSVCTFYKIPHVVDPILHMTPLDLDVIKELHPQSVLVDSAGSSHVITPLKIGQGAYKLASLAVKLEKVARRVMPQFEEITRESIKPSLEVGLEFLHSGAETQSITQNTIRFLSQMDDIDPQFAKFLVDTHYVNWRNPTGGEETVLFSEFCQGDLFGWLASQVQQGVKVNNPSSLLQLLLVLHHVARGLQVIHGLGLTHWDARLENFFLLSEKPGDFPMIKLGDYDFVGPKEKLRGVYGTLNTSAPELFQNMSIQDPQKLDVWAFGIIFYTMFMRGFPLFSERIKNFAGLRRGALPTQKDIDAEIDRYFATIHIDSCKQELGALVRLLKSIFNVEPQKRPDIGTILNSLIVIMGRLKEQYKDDPKLGPALKLTELSTSPEAVRKVSRRS